VIILWRQGKPHLTAKGSNVVHHVNWVGEVLRIPDEVLVVRRVFNIEPQNVEWDLRLVEVGLYFANIIRADVVPTALVIAEREMLGQRWSTCQACILHENVVGRGTRHQEDIQNARFGDPMRFGRLFRGMTDINPCLRSYRIEDTDGRMDVVCVDERNRSVQSHGGIRFILEYIEVPKTIRVSIFGILASGFGEVHSGGVLRKTIDMAVVGESNIKRKGFRSLDTLLHDKCLREARLPFGFGSVHELNRSSHQPSSSSPSNHADSFGEGG